MSISLDRTRAFFWRVLSEIPGWPDAPLPMRLKRILPLAVPCVAMLGLLAWSFGVREHQIANLRASHLRYTTLESDVAELRLMWSEQSSNDLAAKAGRASSRLAQYPDEVEASVRDLKTAIAAAGWDASIQVYEPTAEPDVTRDHFLFTPAVARMEPSPDAAEPFRSLLTILETISTYEKRIDVTRLTVRTNEFRQPGVEINLRIATALDDETLAQ